MAQYITLALGLLVGWAASRLWRIGCVALFYFSFTPQPSWEQSQNNVFVVNSKSGLDGFLDSLKILKSRSTAYHQFYRKAHKQGPRWGRRATPYRKAQYVLLGAVTLSFTTVGLKLATPAFIALIPVSQLGVVVPKECGIPYPSYNETENFELDTSIAKHVQWANAAFAMIDRLQPNESSVFSRETKQITLPAHNTSLNPNTCPVNASICSQKRPFTFTSHYTLTPEHFGLNVGGLFSLQVQESCYGAEPAVTAIGNATWDNRTHTRRVDTKEEGLCTLDYGRFQSMDFTLAQDHGQELAGSYGINVVSSAATSNSPWTPNSNLTQGGDTTLLVYYIGGVFPKDSSTDPIFATRLAGTAAGKKIFRAESSIVPVLCDTKYVICVKSKHDTNCSEPGGIYPLIHWLYQNTRGTTWPDIQWHLSVMLSKPPINKVAIGVSAVLASQSVLQGAAVERHFCAQRTKPIIKGRRVIIESPGMKTVPVLPYALLTGFSILIVAISYTGSFPFSRKLLFSSAKHYHTMWTLHLPGQLHKRVTESLNGKDFKLVDAESPWPNAPFSSGPVIIAHNGVNRFGSRKPGLLYDISESNFDHLVTEPLATCEHSNEV
ncbi:hypothetical protein CPB86DRAFT_828903 [Serendipita vermifera]|nr:hypothetical protein CPB86DRAFT_828903 [Serendipita vermifera]